MPHFVEEFEIVFAALGNDYAKLFARDVIHDALLTRNIKAFEILIDKAFKEIIEILLKAGADVNQKDAYGLTASSWAARSGRLDIMPILSEAAAKAQNMEEMAAAIRDGDMAKVHDLLDTGFDVNYRGPGGQTVLMYAAERGNEYLVPLLVSRGARVDDQNSQGETALMYAAKSGSERVVDFLLKRGAKVDRRSHNDDTALIWAARNGRRKTAEMLINKGADSNAIDKQGRTVLMWAVQGGHDGVIKYLVELGADITIKDKLLKIALDHAKTRNILVLLMLHSHKDALIAYEWDKAKLNMLDVNMRDFISWLKKSSPRETLEKDAPRFAPIVFAMPHFVKEFESMMPFLGKKDFETIFTAEDIKNAIMTRNTKGFEILIDQAAKNNYENLLKLIDQEIKAAKETQRNKKFLADVKAILNKARHVRGILRTSNITKK